MPFKADKERSLKAIECIQRRRGDDAYGYCLRLLVDADGVLRILEEAQGDFTSRTAVAVTIPYGIDPDKVFSAASDPEARLGELISSAFQYGWLEDQARLQNDVNFEFEREDYASIFTFVSPLEWFEGADILVDDDTTNEEIEEYVENLLSDAWNHGYNHFAHAIISRFDFNEFLRMYRDGEV